MTDSYDFAVLGAGVFGLAAAWQLAREGHSVVVFDRSPVGTEASGFALGRVDPPISDALDDPLMLGADPAALAGLDPYTALACRSYEAHRRLRKEVQGISGIDYEFDERPMVELFEDEASRDTFARYAPRWTAAGVPTEFLQPGDFARLDRRIAPPPYGGALIAGGFFVDSLKLAKALEECAYATGAAYRFETVRDLHEDRRGVVVETDAARTRAGAALVALGPWTGEFARRLGVPLPVYPSKGELLRLVPPDGPPLEPHLHGGVSMVQKRDGLLWAAATAAHAGFDRTPTPGAESRLRSAVARAVPWLSGATVAAHTVCFRPETPDGLPVIGRMGGMTRAWVASGGFGWGIMYSFAAGELTARMMLNDSDECAVNGLRPDRFDTGGGPSMAPRAPGRVL